MSQHDHSDASDRNPATGPTPGTGDGPGPREEAAASRPAPLDLAREEESDGDATSRADRTSADAAEPCPNCRTPLPGPHAVLCPSCGYDLLRVKQHTTVVGRPVEVDARAAAAAAGGGDGSDVRAVRPALAAKGGVRVPLAIAGAGILALAVLAFMGVGGFFAREGGHFRDASGAFTLDAPRWIDRFAACGRLVIQSATLALALAGGVRILASVRRSPIGDWATFAARVVAIAVLSQFALLVVLPPPALERSAELLIQGALVLGLVLLWFRLGVQEALQALGATLVLLAVIRLLAWLVVWAT